MWCNHQLGQLVEHSKELISHASVWIINPQNLDETKKFKEKRNAPFVFLSDENLDVIKLYGIYNKWHEEERQHIPYPVTFVIKPDGIVAWRYLGLVPRDRPKVEDVLKALDELTSKSGGMHFSKNG